MAELHSSHCNESSGSLIRNSFLSIRSLKLQSSEIWCYFLGQLLPAFEGSWHVHLQSPWIAWFWTRNTNYRPKRLFPGNSSLQQRLFQNLKFRNEYLFAFHFLSSIISLCSFSAVRARPPLRPSFTRSNPRSATRRIQIMKSVIK
jgi:hypothetical protein